MPLQDASECDNQWAAAVAALLEEPTITAAAERMGVARSTVYRWLDSDDFRDELRRARGRIFETTLSRLQSGATEAVEMLRTIMRDAEAGAAARLSAARAMLDATFRGYELCDMENRVAELEKKIVVVYADEQDRGL